jgi:hypothetical protein
MYSICVCIYIYVYIHAIIVCPIVYQYVKTSSHYKQHSMTHNLFDSSYLVAAIHLCLTG